MNYEMNPVEYLAHWLAAQSIGIAFIVISSTLLLMAVIVMVVRQNEQDRILEILKHTNLTNRTYYQITQPDLFKR